MVSKDMLQGWNDIAEYLRCDVRTAKRWETDKGLPIRRTRRTPGAGRANVYALTAELESWLASAQTTDEPKGWKAATEAEPVAAVANDGAVVEADPAPLEEDLKPGGESGKPAAVSQERVETDRERMEMISATRAEDRGTVAAKREKDAEREPASAPRRELKGRIAGTVAACLLAFGSLLWVHAHAAVRTGGVEASGEGRHGAGARQEEAAAASAADARVQELYLHGSYLFEHRTPETLTQARNDFEEAVRADPNYAPGYAGLAKTYDLLREYATMPSEQAYPLAKAAALRAIALDPGLPDAHAALAYEEFFWEWNPEAAEKEFREAIALDANSGIAHHWYGAMLLHEARFAEALRELDRAQMLEPASAGVLGTRAYAIGLSGRRGEAVDLLQDILARVPDAAPLHFILAQLCLQEPRDIPRFLDEMRRFAVLRHDADEARMINAAEPAYREGGEAAMWRTMLKTERAEHPSEATYQRASLEAAVGMKEEALKDLTELVQRHDAAMIGIAIDPTLQPLRDDARFAALMRQVGLPQAKDAAAGGR